MLIIQKQKNYNIEHFSGKRKCWFRARLHLQSWWIGILHLVEKWKQGVKFINFLWPAFFQWHGFLKLFSTNSLCLYFLVEIILVKKLLVNCWWNWLKEGDVCELSTVNDIRPGQAPTVSSNLMLLFFCDN